jgi:hypothetical protein
LKELDEKLDELPNVREELVSKYQEKKEMQLKINKNKDYLEEKRLKILNYLVAQVRTD